jgi:hypothetical protein
MFSSCSMVMDDHAGYSGSHLPSVSWMSSTPAASSFKTSTLVKLFVMLPICHSVPGQIGPPFCKDVLPAAAARFGPFSDRLT